MRFTTWFHRRTSWAPKKLVAKMPVSSTISSVRIAPSPGTWMPSQFSVCSRSGSSSSDWSSTSTTSFSTQMVMASGIQISSPVMKYFFMSRKTNGPARAGPDCGAALESVGAGRGGRFLGFGLRFRLGFGLRVGLRLAALQVRLLVRRLLAGGLEVGGVPAAALELEAGGAPLLLIGLLAA